MQNDFQEWNILHCINICIFFLLVIFEKVNIYSNKIAGYTFWESGSFENPHILEIFCEKCKN